MRFKIIAVRALKFVVGWLLTTFCVVGAYSSYVFVQVNRGYEWKLITPEYPQVIDYRYTELPPPLDKKKK